MERIEMFKMDLEELKNEFIELQENQLKVLNELSKIDDLDELSAEIKDAKCDFKIENENFIEEFMYISKKLFKEMTEDILDKADDILDKAEPKSKEEQVIKVC